MCVICSRFVSSHSASLAQPKNHKCLIEIIWVFTWKCVVIILVPSWHFFRWNTPTFWLLQRPALGSFLFYCIFISWNIHLICSEKRYACVYVARINLELHVLELACMRKNTEYLIPKNNNNRLECMHNVFTCTAHDVNGIYNWTNSEQFAWKVKKKEMKQSS